MGARVIRFSPVAAVVALFAIVVAVIIGVVASSLTAQAAKPVPQICEAEGAGKTIGAAKSSRSGTTQVGDAAAITITGDGSDIVFAPKAGTVLTGVVINGVYGDVLPNVSSGETFRTATPWTATSKGKALMSYACGSLAATPSSTATTTSSPTTTVTTTTTAPPTTTTAAPEWFNCFVSVTNTVTDHTGQPVAVDYGLIARGDGYEAREFNVLPGMEANLPFAAGPLEGGKQQRYEVNWEYRYVGDDGLTHSVFGTQLLSSFDPAFTAGPVYCQLIT